MDEPRDWLPVNQVDAEMWGKVEEAWQEANAALDRGIAHYRHHREHTVCPHPTCVSAGFGDALEAMGAHELRGLLHAAIHRIEVNRLEREAGL